MKRMLAAITILSLGLLAAPGLSAQSPESNPLALSQWVRLADDGALHGRVVLPRQAGQVESLQGLRVSLLSADGKVLSTLAGDDGQFSVPSLTPGVYALIARGDDLFACCAMHVLESSEGKGEFPAVTDIPVASLDSTLVNTAMIRYLPPVAQPASGAISTEQLASVAAQTAGGERFRVAQSNGGMKGRLLLAGSDLQGAEMTNVFVFDGTEEVERALTDRQGNFAIEQLKPGAYSLLAISGQGLAIAGFELVDADARSEALRAAASNGEVKLVSQADSGELRDSFAMQIASLPVDAVATVLVDHHDADELHEDQVVMEEVELLPPGEGEEVVPYPCSGEDLMGGFGMPMAGAPGYGPYGAGYYGGGGGGGYGGGGGGGGFGGGGLGGLAALAGIGGVIAATTTDDDNNASFPVASPTIPSGSSN